MEGGQHGALLGLTADGGEGLVRAVLHELLEEARTRKDPPRAVADLIDRVVTPDGFVTRAAVVPDGTGYLVGGTRYADTAALVDGNTASVTGALGFSTALQTSATAAQWVQVDLGATQSIDQVVLYPRTDVTGGFPLGFTRPASTPAMACPPSSPGKNACPTAASWPVTWPRA